MFDPRKLTPARLKAGLRFWWRVVHGAIRLWLERNAFSYAGSLAFYTLFSLAPTVIIAVTVIGLVLGEEAAHGQIVAQLQGTMGQDAAAAIEAAVAQSRIEESGLLPTLLGFGALMVGATTVFAQMQFSLNTIWGVTARPSANSALVFIKNRLLSLTVVLSIGFILLVSLVLGVMLRAALQAADEMVPYVGLLTTTAEFLVSLAVIAALFATIFKVLPDVVLSWRDVVVGALVTALLFAVGRSVIAVYLSHTATASTYGAAGSVVMILLWVYYSSLILLLGAAFTRCHLTERGKPLVPRNTAVVVRRELLDDGQRKASAPGTTESTTSAVADSDPGPIERDVIER
ncbi:YihY/virulence factor BrkB family protein [Halomonas alimentaria]|uniref:YihY family inner membrane protein n=1 Tax=Halomonas alimentaria TaxID=147248 RepID=A0A7X4W5U3_9GAMM|nr:YihY/virulence factor BrkB family protein [Halomonas alimentaria]NAW34932.1 YihY family inner membrane protein [Halomonas alimentaria]